MAGRENKTAKGHAFDSLKAGQSVTSWTGAEDYSGTAWGRMRRPTWRVKCGFGERYPVRSISNMGSSGPLKQTSVRLFGSGQSQR